MEALEAIEWNRMQWNEKGTEWNEKERNGIIGRKGLKVNGTISLDVLGHLWTTPDFAIKVLKVLGALDIWMVEED